MQLDIQVDALEEDEGNNKGRLQRSLSLKDDPEGSAKIIAMVDQISTKIDHRKKVAGNEDDLAAIRKLELLVADIKSQIDSL